MLRWIVRGERHVTTSLDALSDDLRALQRRVDDIAARRPPAAPEPFVPGPDPWLVAAEPSTSGVNVVGYLQHQIGLGDAGRRMCDVLAAGDVATSPIAYGATSSPLLPVAYPTTQRVDHDTTIVVAAADQLPALRRDHPELFDASRRVVAHPFWEVSELSPAGSAGLELVDEVWAPTSFVADVFARAGDVAVRHVPLPFARPRPSGRARSSFAALADAGERIVFGVTFDHFSVMERKNPLGAIEAYRRAFPPGSDTLLVVKTLNAGHHPIADAQLRAAAAHRSDVVVWDEHLDRADQLAFIAQLDVLVSLHRGEGLGLHLAEAMWSGVPVVATGWSGNVDFMDDSCARLVDHTLVEVRGGGTIYPDGARWADPDLDAAAGAMSSLAGDDVLRGDLGRAARRRMQDQPDDRSVARGIAGLLEHDIERP